MTDRELDAKVAETIFGWAWLTNLHSRWLGPPCEIGQPRAWIGPDTPESPKIRAVAASEMDQFDAEGPWWLAAEPQFIVRRGERDELPRVPLYSSSVQGAFLVVEEMWRRKLSVEIGTFLSGWNVLVWDNEASDERDYVYDASLPRAICLAALSALDSAKEGA